MAFKSTVETNVGTTQTTLHTTAAGKADTLIGLSFANILGQSVLVSAYLYKSGSATEAHIVKDAIVPTGNTFIAVGGDQKIVMEAGDELRVISDTASAIDAIVSRLESDV